jgi:N-acetylglucosaminyldiphosphoundecaprenol N-acetyl-beta-D-mannosaminyltransferase
MVSGKRAKPALDADDGERMTPSKIRLFGIDFDNLTMDEAVDMIADEYAKSRKRTMVATANVDHIMLLERDPRFREDYAKAGMVLADGAPLIFASRLLGTPLKERVAGSDIFPLLCARAARIGLRVMLLGGGEGVARQAADNLAAKCPGLVIEAHGPSFGFDNKPDECAQIVSRINEFQPHILFVGMGAPRQERWIAKHKGSYCPCVSIGVGASIDFEAGRIKRAPVILRKIGFEWLYRLAKEPKRLYRRYLIEDRRFVRLLFRELKERRSGGSGLTGPR